jgi:hypothetical protein
MTVIRSEEWSNAHLEVNELLSQLLNAMRDCGYNPSQHISYDHEHYHVIVDQDVLDHHPRINQLYGRYLAACKKRDEAMQQIQSLPKVDLGLSKS